MAILGQRTLGIQDNLEKKIKKYLFKLPNSLIHAISCEVDHN